MLQKIRTRALYLALRAGALLVLPAVVMPVSAETATATPAELEAFLNERYYEVEFFVFERTAVLDFATEEILTLDRPRALPRAIRTQRLAPEALWNGPLNTLTRACLTFPTLTYEMQPAESDTLEVSALTADTGTETGIEAETSAQAETERGPAAAVPTPAIMPTLAPNPQLDFLAHMAEFERRLEADSQHWQPAENFRLQRAANRIERRGYGRILFHGRWLEAVPPRETPSSILVEGGQRLNPPLPGHELIGSVGVTLGRYLHFKADLFFHGPGLGLSPAGAAMNATGDSLLVASATDTGSQGYMQLSESRRMRSEELHYLDHPKLGLVVRIDPVSFPPALLSELEALKALEESTD